MNGRRQQMSAGRKSDVPRSAMPGMIGFEFLVMLGPPLFVGLPVILAMGEFGDASSGTIDMNLFLGISVAWLVATAFGILAPARPGVGGVGHAEPVVRGGGLIFRGTRDGSAWLDMAGAEIAYAGGDPVLVSVSTTAPRRPGAAPRASARTMV